MKKVQIDVLVPLGYGSIGNLRRWTYIMAIRRSGRMIKGSYYMPTGTVKFFNESKGFGFIQPEGGGADAFVHISDVERSGMSTLRENDRVSYDVEADQRGKMKATNLKSA